MVKTLKITSISIGIIALILLVFVASKGFKGDPAIEKRLSETGIAEKMKNSGPGKKIDTDQDSPLVRQAKAFALRIDPPPAVAKSTPKRRPGQKASIPRPKAAVSAKFKLLGTSYHTDDEQNSWALISEVGKGLHWVKYGDSVGHLKIEKIGPGAVLINDGGKTYEMVADRVEKPDYVTSYSGTAPEEMAIAGWGTKQVSEAIAITQPAEEVPQISKEMQAKAKAATEADIKANIKWLKDLQNNPEDMGMTAEEAKSMEGLGELLKSLEDELPVESNESDVNKADPNAAKSEPLPEALLKLLKESSKDS